MNTKRVPLYEQAKEAARLRGEPFFCEWCWNKPSYAGYWTHPPSETVPSAMGLRFCNRCNPKETR